MKGSFPIEKFNTVRTPFYYYDTELLRKTLDTIKAETGKNDNYHVHYAVKANANRKLLRIISAAGFGADCVSGGEIKACLDAGFPAEKIVFAGVGKSDWEINVEPTSTWKAYRNWKSSTSWLAKKTKSPASHSVSIRT